MTPVELSLVAVSLGMDAFSVALGVGVHQRGPRPTFRLSFHFGLFQFLMPLVGWGLSRQVAHVVHAYAAWIAAGILALIAVHMFVASAHSAPTQRPTTDPTRGWTLVGLCVATSIDALGVGVGMGVLESGHVGYAGVIGVVAAGMTLAGLWLARRVGPLFGKHAERLGAIILLAVACRMVLT